MIFFLPASLEMCTFILTKHEMHSASRRNFIYFWCQKQQYQREAFNKKRMQQSAHNTQLEEENTILVLSAFEIAFSPFFIVCKFMHVNTETRKLISTKQEKICGWIEKVVAVEVFFGANSTLLWN